MPDTTHQEDVYRRLGVATVINASGMMTALGGSLPSPRVSAAMAEAAGAHVRIDDLMAAAGRRIAAATGTEAGCPTSGAAAGIAISAAAVIAGTSLPAVERLPDTGGLPDEIVLPLGHAVHFGAPVTQMVRLGGGRPVVVGSANTVTADHLEGAIGARTAALLYVQSHHAVRKGMPPLAEFAAVARRNGVPLIIDAAAEEDLRAYAAAGGDLVVYSGGKAVGGPASGFICGRSDLVAACRMQYQGVARAMKVGKETIAGLVAALEAYTGVGRSDDADGPAQAADQRTRMEELRDGVAAIPGLRAAVVPDEAGRAIVRCEIRVDPAATGLSAEDVVARLAAGDPAIVVRGHRAAEGVFAVDPRPLAPGEEHAVLRRLAEIMTPPQDPA
ncbi:DgaE family pyridoxal phosphate-dependent ammonia lyase [Nocardiopsis mangrovi]|uniref:DgaE family pyridoxal phosphate-dependent ammonia lyase n=1 Tax=Nocardiopsis mangrovi TaxID=1179818 RepID=A0ABV9E012_9ACTN